MKKTKIAIFVLALVIMGACSQVFAMSELSSLYMAVNTILEGEYRDYAASNYAISINPYSFYDWASSCTLTKDLYKKDLIGKTFLAGRTDTMKTLNTTYEYYMGCFAPYRAAYYFETGLDGGIMSDTVYLINY